MNWNEAEKVLNLLVGDDNYYSMEKNVLAHQVRYNKKKREKQIKYSVQSHQTDKVYSGKSWEEAIDKLKEAINVNDMP